MSKETDDADLLLAKISRLMNLAESDNENESRNAAWQAVRLIKSSHVLGVIPDGYVYALVDGRMCMLKKEKSTSQAPSGWVQVMGEVLETADVLERAINQAAGHGPRRPKKPRNSPYKRPT